MAKMICLSAGLFFSVTLAMAPAGAAVDCKADPANSACPAAKTAPNSPKSQPLAGPAKPQRAAKGAPKPLSEPRAVGTAKKTGSAGGKNAAKPAAVAPAPTRLAHRPSRHPPTLTRRDGRRERPLAEEALGDFARSYPEYRPQSGPVYDIPPGATPPAIGCDEVCQYRDWLNRYAAWYRDFGRYYYDGAGMPGRRGAPPPPSLGFNNPPRTPAAPAQLDQSERDRMDPWHGYNPRNGLGNGY